MEVIHLVFRLLALSQICFTFLYLLILQRNRNGAIMLSVCLCFMSYLSAPLVSSQLGEGLLLMLLALLATLIPAALWLLGNRFFNDDTAIPAAFVVASTTYVVLWYIGELELLRFDNDDLGNVLFELIPQLIKLGLVLHLIYIALTGKQHDLVSRRMQMRVPLAAGCGIAAALVIVVEIWASGTTPMIIEGVGSVFMFVLALAINLFLFRWREDFPLALGSPGTKLGAPSARSEEALNSDKAALKDIERQMLESRFYSKHGATLSDFAEVLNLPAYRLRSLINQHMGFQNFNQFLNHYRILEASERLRSQPQLPILTIALDVGFKSMSSFNQAFKNVHRITPSHFRETTGD